jgi:hypothetical protein
MNSGSSSLAAASRSTAFANAPSFCAAARRTMGVSSAARRPNRARSSCRAAVAEGGSRA